MESVSLPQLQCDLVAIVLLEIRPAVERKCSTAAKSKPGQIASEAGAVLTGAYGIESRATGDGGQQTEPFNEIALAGGIGADEDGQG